VPVADPYRWLENDVREDSKVAAWVAQQNALTDSYLATLPGRATFEQRLRELFNFERFGVPRKEGNRYFYSRNTGLQNQNVLYVREGLNGTPRMLIDPNTWSQDGATALAEWEPSQDGRRVLYSVQEGGTDWRVVRVLDVDTGRVLPDEVKWVKFANVDWAKDGSGFYYSRFPEPKAAEQFQSLNENHTVYFHRLGTPQSQDRLIYADTARPKLSNVVQVSDDGRWLIVTSSEGTDERYDVTLIDVTRPGATPRKLVTGLQNQWDYVGNIGNTFYWSTNTEAPRLRIVSTDISRPGLEVRKLVAQDEATLGGASIVGRQLIASYLVDAKTEVRTFTLDGKPTGKVTLPGIGTASGFSGDPEDSETFFAFSSFNMPTTIYRYDSATGRHRPGRSRRSPSGPRIIPSASASTARRTGRGCRCSSSTGATSTCARPIRRFSTAMAASTRRCCRAFRRRGWRGWSKAASSRSPTSAAAANMARRGTMPAGSPSKQNVFDDFHRRGRISDPRRDHDQGQARHPGRLRTEGCSWVRSSTSGRTCSPRRCRRSA
jgi:prolyl oligopeptidase